MHIDTRQPTAPKMIILQKNTAMHQAGWLWNRIRYGKFRIRISFLKTHGLNIQRLKFNVIFIGRDPQIESGYFKGRIRCFLGGGIRIRFLLTNGSGPGLFFSSGSGHFVPATLHFQAVVLEFARAKSGLQDYNVFARHNSN